MTRPAQAEIERMRAVIASRNIAADNLRRAQTAVEVARRDLVAWEQECWKRLPAGYGLTGWGTEYRDFVKLDGQP